MAADWVAIKTEYITGDCGYRELADKYGVPLTTLARKGKAEHWPEERKRHDAKLVTKTLTAAVQKQANRVTRMQTVADKLLGKIERAVDEYEADELIRGDGRVMRNITGALKDLKDVQMLRSDADLREQEARIAKLQRDAQRGEDERDKTVRVLIEGGEDAWSR